MKRKDTTAKKLHGSFNLTGYMKAEAHIYIILFFDQNINHVLPKYYVYMTGFTAAECGPLSYYIDMSICILISCIYYLVSMQYEI